MDKSIFFVRSQIPSSDGRLSRYLNILDENKIGYNVVAWNRGIDKLSSKHIIYFNKKSAIGGGYRNIIGLVSWNFFILYSLLKNIKKIKIIHAVDFDSVLPCYLVSKIFSLRLIFDSYDRYSDCRAIKSPAKKVIDVLETYILKNADFSILPSSKRVPQYRAEGFTNIVFFENVPNLVGNEFLNSSQFDTCKKRDFSFTFCYVGVLEQTHRGIEMFLEVFSRYPQFFLVIAGDGPLSDLVTEYASVYPNIKYLGAIDYNKTKQILLQSDLHLAFYYLTSLNHKYAAPNKYYEHLFFGRPLLTTVNTPPGDLVSLNRTGFALLEGREHFEDFLQTINCDEIKIRGVRARKIWEEEYSDYYARYMVPSYLKMIK